MEGNPRLCMASAVGGYVSTYGKDEPMGCYEDIDHADLMLLVGSNAAEAHPYSSSAWRGGSRLVAT